MSTWFMTVSISIAVITIRTVPIFTIATWWTGFRWRWVLSVPFTFTSVVRIEWHCNVDVIAWRWSEGMKIDPLFQVLLGGAQIFLQGIQSRDFIYLVCTGSEIAK
jgi:hypothetical protein